MMNYDAHAQGDVTQGCATPKGLGMWETAVHRPCAPFIATHAMSILDKLPTQLLHELMTERGHGDKTVAQLSELEHAQMILYYQKLLRYQSEAGYTPDTWPSIPNEERHWANKLILDEYLRKEKDDEEIDRVLLVDWRIKQRRAS